MTPLPAREQRPALIRESCPACGATVDAFPTPFRVGYLAALDDIERTGLQPTTDKTRRECADRALKRLVDE